jgi:uncharacterized protein YjbI with pentapeptide repeats
MQGLQQWDQWRKANPAVRPDLAGAVLSGVDLHGIDLSAADLRGACLCGADLRKANLAGAFLAEADLSGTLLTDSILTSVFFTGAILGGADLGNADLREANLSGADLSGSRLSGAVFRNTSPAGLPPGDAKLSRATTLTFCILRGADLSRCDLRGVDLSGARLGGAKLQDALLCKATLSGIDLRGADLSRVDARGANFYDACLEGANLTESNLSDADLGGVRLAGASMRGALLRRASLRCADCSSADFSNAVFQDTNLAGALLDGSRAAGVSCRGIIRDEKTSQLNLAIGDGRGELLVDTLEAAELLHIHLDNPGAAGRVLHSVNGAFVLLFGEVSGKREMIAALAQELRQRGYPPLIADIALLVNTERRDFFRRLAPLCQFAIGDLSMPAPFPEEVLAVFYENRIPLLPLVPESYEIPAVLDKFGSQISWLSPVSYGELGEMKEGFEKAILLPVEQKRRQMKEILRNLEYLI